MAAEIRSTIPAKPTVDNASRDDLAVGDVVTLEAVPPATGTTFVWTLVFVPEGSAAVLTPPAAAFTAGPVTFTADLAGPYLVRLVVDAGLPTESTQYVRLRAGPYTGTSEHLQGKDFPESLVRSFCMPRPVPFGLQRFEGRYGMYLDLSRPCAIHQ